ncbi:glycosyltransferase family 39 protein [Candidatus Curtissbacteria bacterium]|nr:glycosyltransferase family 39 protein [Candidatus Curtissbacteria bacterium]
MILKVFIFWRISLFALTYLGSIVFPKVANGGIGAIGPGKNFDFLASWAQWDGGHFINIASYGYFSPQEYAFFPLLPNLVRVVSIFTFGNHVLAGLLLTNTAFFLFLIIFYKLLKKRFGAQIAVTTIITFLTFPTAFFGVAVYSESIFLLLAVLTLYFLENKKFLAAVIVSGLATATRVVGIFLLIPVIWSLFFSHSGDPAKPETPESFQPDSGQARLAAKRARMTKILLLPLSISGLLLYSLYLYLKFGDPFYFSTVQSAWHRLPANPLTTIYSYLTINTLTKPFNDYLDIASTIGFLAILVLGFRKIPKPWWLYSLLVILIPASSGTLTSMPRYVLSAFPVFILMGIYLADKVVLKTIIWGIFLVLQISLAVLFVNGYWVS